MTNIDNCAKTMSNANVCTGCDLNQNLMPDSNKENNKCVNIPSYISENCEVYFIDIQNNDYKCK